MSLCHPTGPVPKGQCIKDRKYLDWLREQPCILTGQRGHDSEAVDPAHIGTYGRGMKTDNEALPILHSLHVEGHASGEVSMLRKHAPDDVIRDAFRALADKLYREWKAGR